MARYAGTAGQKSAVGGVATMKRRLCWLVAAALVLASTGCTRQEVAEPATSNGWREFTAPGGEFSVLLPGEPTASTDTTSNDGTAVAQHKFDLVLREDGKAVAGYLTSYADFRNGGIAATGESSFLEKTWQGSYSTMKGTLVYKRLTNYQGHSALEWQTRRERKGRVSLVTWRNVISGDRLYMLSAVMNENRVQAGAAARYLDSFKILK